MAPLANLTLNSSLPGSCRADARAAPRGAAAGVRGPHASGAWARKRAARPPARKIVFFHGCGTEYYEPEVGEKVVEVLEHNGFHVEVPKQGCCGLPLQSNGLFDDARKYVLRLARSLAAAPGDGSIIVGNATSCTVMLKREAREILGLEDDPDLALVSRRPTTSASCCSSCTTRASSRPTFSRSTRRSPTTPPASSKGTGSASPRSSCCG